jgi:ketosteroid isomerase-like protein
MKNQWMTIALLCVAAAQTCAIAGAKGSISTKEATRDVEQVFDRYVQGWNQGSVEILSAIYANDARLTVYWPDPSNPSVQGWDTVKKDLADVFKRIHGMALDFVERKVEIYGDVAVLTSNWTWKEPAAPMFEHGRASFVFQRRNQKWMVVHEHSSIMPFLAKAE